MFTDQEGQQIILVGQGGYATSSPSQPCLLGADEINDSVLLIVQDPQSQQSALFNIDCLTHQRTLLKEIQDLFPGDTPLSVKVQTRKELSGQQEVSYSEKNKFEETQAKLKLNLQTIERTINQIRRTREIDQENFYFRARNNQICIFNPSTGVISGRTLETHYANKTLKEKFTDNLYCRKQYNQALRLSNPTKPMVNFSENKGNLSRKQIQYLTKDSWYLGKISIDEKLSPQDREIETRKFFVSLHNCAYKKANLVVSRANPHQLISYLDIDRAEQLITQGLLNSAFGPHLLNITQQESDALVAALDSVTEHLKSSIYRKTGLNHWVQRFFTGHTEFTKKPSHGVNFEQMNLDSIAHIFQQHAQTTREPTKTSPTSSVCSD